MNSDIFSPPYLQKHCYKNIASLHCIVMPTTLKQHCSNIATQQRQRQQQPPQDAAFLQKHCNNNIATLHCIAIATTLQQHCDATPTTTTTTSTTISRLFLVLWFEALALRIVALASASRDEGLTVEALALASALRVQALALALRVQALALALALSVEALALALRVQVRALALALALRVQAL